MPKKVMPFVVHASQRSARFRFLEWYDYKTPLLRVTFCDGKQYEYAGVSQKAFNQLASAQSLGRHYDDHIRGKFAAKELGTVGKSYTPPE